MTRLEIVQTAKNYIGVKYVPHGKSPIFGLGCWGFFSRVCHDLGLHATHIPDQKYEQLLQTVLQSLYYMGFNQTKNSQFGDVLVRIKHFTGHTGIMTNNKLIHATKNGIQETKIIGSWIGFNFPGVK